MSAQQLDDLPVSYEQLEDLEDDFEEVELELLRQSAKLTKDLYAKRQEVVSKIPSFWPLVFEQSPMDIDEYIQPSDSEVLSTALTGLSVERFELPNGDPRSIAIRFEFSENKFFEDKVLEKKFWWRYAKDGWSGLVSEPVNIKWKKGEDLTGGMLPLVVKIWEDDKAGKTEEETPAKTELQGLMEEHGINGGSFFAWFGFRGRAISAEESEEARRVNEDKRKARKEGMEVDVKEEEEEEDDEDDEYEYEIFPTGDDLAISIAEDLWPNAIKFFTSAQEADMSDIDFEEVDEMDEDVKEEDEKPSKKRKA